jgi:hypothetical protein
MEMFLNHDITIEVVEHLNNSLGDVFNLMCCCSQIHNAFTQWREPIASQLPSFLSARSEMDFEEFGEEMGYYNYVYYPEIHFAISAAEKIKAGLKIVLFFPSLAHHWNARIELTYLESAGAHSAIGDVISILTRPGYDDAGVGLHVVYRTHFSEFDYAVTHGELSSLIGDQSPGDYIARFLLPSDFGPVLSKSLAFKLDLSSCNYYDVYCFHPESLIRLHGDASRFDCKKASELRVGDRVFSLVDPTHGSAIEAITVQSLSLPPTTTTTTTTTTTSDFATGASHGPYRAIEMCRVGEAWVTMGHPLQCHVNRKSERRDASKVYSSETAENDDFHRVVEDDEPATLWQRAGDCLPVVSRCDVPALYNFVTSTRHALVIGTCGTEASSLGQFCRGVDRAKTTILYEGANGLDCASHECNVNGGVKVARQSNDYDSFFGSEKVVDYLKRFPSWPNVTLTHLQSRLGKEK